jgi:hypothetical protein
MVVLSMSVAVWIAVSVTASKRSYIAGSAFIWYVHMTGTYFLDSVLKVLLDVMPFQIHFCHRA